MPVEADMQQSVNSRLIKISAGILDNPLSRMMTSFTGESYRYC
jgi:hypothetical protein